jgi:hypothetical protein
VVHREQSPRNPGSQRVTLFLINSDIALPHYFTLLKITTLPSSSVAHPESRFVDSATSETLDPNERHHKNHLASVL